jgi:hypothetical protein
MKKYKILTIAMFIVLSIGQMIAQPVAAANNNEIKKLKIEEKSADRPALRKLEGTEVNQDSKTSFYMTIGNVPDISWTRGTYYDEATFNKDGVAMKAYFDINGSLVGTTTIKKATDLNKSLEKSIKKQYGDYTIGQVTYFKDNEDNATDMMLYGLQFESKTHYFIELSKGDSKIVVMDDGTGDLSLFKQL